jgi:hypothetical protein
MGPYHVTQVREAVFSAEATTSSGKHVVSGMPVAALVQYPYIDFSNRKRIPALSRRWEGHGWDEVVVEPLSTLRPSIWRLSAGPCKRGFFYMFVKGAPHALGNPNQPLLEFPVTCTSR